MPTLNRICELQGWSDERVIRIAFNFLESEGLLGEFMDWMPESAAVLYTDRSREYLRARFARLAERGLAEWRGRVRYFRRCALEHRGNADAARQEGRRAAKGDAA